MPKILLLSTSFLLVGCTNPLARWMPSVVPTPPVQTETGVVNTGTTVNTGSTTDTGATVEPVATGAVIDDTPKVVSGTITPTSDGPEDTDLENADTIIDSLEKE